MRESYERLCSFHTPGFKRMQISRTSLSFSAKRVPRISLIIRGLTRLFPPPLLVRWNVFRVYFAHARAYISFPLSPSFSYPVINKSRYSFFTDYRATSPYSSMIVNVLHFSRLDFNLPSPPPRPQSRAKCWDNIKNEIFIIEKQLLRLSQFRCITNK